MSMKGKKRSLVRLGLALVLATSLAIIMAPTAALAVINDLVITVTPNTAGVAAEYKIDFFIHTGLTHDYNCFVIELPTGTTVPGTIATTNVAIYDITAGTGAQKPSSVVVDSLVTQPGMYKRIRVYMPTVDPGIAAFHDGRVVFKSTAGIYNPAAAGQYCAWVYTDEEPTPQQDCYDITTGPVDIYLKYQVPEQQCGYIVDEHVSSFNKIQDALDYADEIWLGNTIYPSWSLYSTCPPQGGYVGCKIVVQPGTYYETIVIDTPGVELCSHAGADVTIINGTNKTTGKGLKPAQKNAVVFITTGGVTFGGMMHGFTVINGGLNLYSGIPDNAGWEMDDDPWSDIFGIAVMASCSDKSMAPIVDVPMAYAYNARVNIVDNVVYNNQASGIAVWGGTVLVSNNDVHDNDWAGFYGNCLHTGVEICDPDAFTHGVPVSNEVINNQFYNNGYDGIRINTAYEYPMLGVRLESVNNMEGVPIHLYIVGNDIHDNVDAGIALMEGATGDGNSTVISIKFNQILNNNIGICTTAMYPTMNIACVYNNIAGNTVWGIKNWDEDLLIAKMNWWGEPSGPSDGEAPTHPSEMDPDQTAIPPAMGTGDAVSHNVIYQWWLTWPFENVQTDLKRYYGSDRYQGMENGPYDIPWAPIIPLKQGWNTLSTPVALDQRADELDEIVNLGGWMDNYQIGYSYDPAGGWQLLTGSYQFLPMEAVYVRINGPEMYDPELEGSYAALFPILLRGATWLPARDLEPGWNLVGLCGDFWNENPDNIITDMPVDEALSSISSSWSNAISPTMPGQVESWVCTPSNAGNYDMFTGDGYWVYVTKSTTLAGFSMAPWYLNWWEMEILNCLIPFIPF